MELPEVISHVGGLVASHPLPTIGALLIGGLYVHDIRQKKHSLLRGYPVIGRCRYYLEEAGVFLRQYIVSNDAEELPFSRNQRSQVYRMAKKIDDNKGFGSTAPTPKVVFANSAFPKIPSEMDHDREIVIGEDTRHPFRTKKLFNVSGMSFGAISENAVRALSKGAAMSGVTINTGEGGRPSDHHLSGGGHIVQQLGTANFGFQNDDGTINFEAFQDSEDNPQIAYTQLKIQQGAKPGKGGMLPGIKVTEEIARLRNVPLGENCYSPNRNPSFPDIDSILTSIRKIKQVSGKPVGIKIVMSDAAFLDKLCRRGLELDADYPGECSHLPSVITVDGGDGGSGSAPALLMEAVGLPVMQVLASADQCLKDRNLRGRIKLSCSGRLVTPYDVALALANGADWVESARGFAMALGCIMSLSCHSDKCPTGIATQNKRRQRVLNIENKAERVAHYADEMHRELFMLAASCGERHPSDLSPKNLRQVIASS